MCDDCEWADFVKDAGNLVKRLEDLPDRADDFADGATEKAESMAAWADEHEHVTDRMVTALENISRATARWER